jgi:hypothetical protein
MAQARIRSIDDAVEKLYDLNVGVVGTAEGDRHERPHKPVLLLAALDLIADGQARADHIQWSRALRSRFAEYFNLVRSRDDRVTPENPFRYLQSDGIWKSIESMEGRAVPLQREPRVGECDTGRISAALADGLEDCVLTPSNRMRLREALVARYFPEARARVELLALTRKRSFLDVGRGSHGIETGLGILGSGRLDSRAIVPFPLLRRGGNGNDRRGSVRESKAAGVAHDARLCV